MEKLTAKRTSVLRALKALSKSLKQYENACTSTSWPKQFFDDREDFIRTVRDSMIQRFEFCVDITWKYLKDYLEKVEEVTLDIKTPRSTFRALCNARIITEKEASVAMMMVEDRNTTSHIYKEEIAEEISSRIKNYYDLLNGVVTRKTRHTHDGIK